ncbi:MAG: PilZ domain-containing protein [Planctomycetota bacterium]
MSTPARFDRRTTRRVAAPRTAIVLRAGARPVPLGDLSLQGVGLTSTEVYAEGQSLELQLVHPRLGALSLRALVRWCAVVAGSERPRLGLEFSSVDPAQRNHLRRLLAAESGSCVLAQDAVQGFLLTVSPGALWSLFDERATQVATVQRDEQARYLVAARGTDPCGPPRYAQASSLGEVAAEVFALRAAPRFDPVPEGEAPSPSGAHARPPSTASHPRPASTEAQRRAERAPAPPPAPPPARTTNAASAPSAERRAPAPSDAPPAAPQPAPRAPRPAEPRPAPPRSPAARPAAQAPAPAASPPPVQPLRGHCVRDGARRVMGYAALTGEGVWSLYDDEVEQIGVLQQSTAGYTVYWLGDTPESSIVAVDAETFPAALAVAFEIDTLPELSHAVISPGQRSAEVPGKAASPRRGPGSRVLFRKRVLGYVCESALDQAWSVLDKQQEQIALLARDPFPPYAFRVCLMGASADESMEYIVHESLLGALASAFELPGPPLLDPPLELPAPGGGDDH